MEKFQIVAPATFPAGSRLGLSKAQAEARAHALNPLGKGIFVAVLPVQFKAGETVSYDGELPKAMAESLSRAKSKAAAELPPVIEVAPVVDASQTIVPVVASATGE